MKQETADLSERELEILRLVATGASNKEIAQELFISPNTVKVHLRNIFEKIGAVSRTEATLFAIRNGLSSAGLSNEQAPVVESNPIFNTPEVITDTINPLPSLDRASKSWKWGIAVLGAVILVLSAITIYLAFVLPGRQNEQLASTGVPQTEKRWTEHADMPTARFGLAGVVFNNEIFAIGGETSNGITGIVERYDPGTNTWTTVAHKPTPVTDIKAALINGRVFVPGGRLESGLPTDVLEIFDPNEAEWSNGEPLPIAVSGYALAAFEGNIYIFGGWDGKKYLDSVYMYQPALDQWSDLPSLPSPRGFSGAAVANRQIFIIGGYADGVPIDDIVVFEPDLPSNAMEQWSISFPMSEARYNPGVASVAETLFIIGGKNIKNRFLQPLMFIPISGEWQQTEPAPVEFYSDMATVGLGSNIFIIGGVVGGKPSAHTFSFRAIYTLNIPYISNEQ